MQSTQLNPEMKSALLSILHSYPLFEQIVSALLARGGKVYVVGGAVRDLVLRKPIKDIDVEIHALELAEVESILSSFGPTSTVGKSFGVIRVHGLDIDWSLPRTDSSGRKPVVSIDPCMGIERALKRRDLTMNALAIDVATYQLIDPFGGVADMHHKILKTPDAAFFVEDPLRFYRVMQFIGRFDMYPDDVLQQICMRMDVSTVSRERVSDEIEKLLLKSDRPSRGFRWLVSINRLSQLFPELGALVGCAQEHEYHPEGDVFEHTMQVLDAAARCTEYKNEREKLIIMLAALCHDLGKPHTTVLIDGRLKSRGHAQAGVVWAKKFLARLTIKKELIPAVCLLVENHMQVSALVKQHAGPAAYKRLAHELDPYVTLRQLALLVCADRRGRNPDGTGVPFADADEVPTVFLARAHDALVADSREQPLLLGRDIADVVAPGPEMGALLHDAYEIQLNEGIRDKDVLKRRVTQKIKRT